MKKSIFSPDYKQLLARLKRARAVAKLSQQEVAAKLSKPQSFISKVESGERRIDITELKHLARAYKKPIAYFIQ